MAHLIFCINEPVATPCLLGGGAANFFYKLIKRRGMGIQASVCSYCNHDMEIKKRKDVYFIQVLYYKYGHDKCYFISLFLISRAKKKCHLTVGIRCQESARMQDLVPFTRELLGAQTPGRKGCQVSILSPPTF